MCTQARVNRIQNDCRNESVEASRPDTDEIRALLGTSEFPHLHSDHTLDVALHRMGSSNMQELPVVSRRDVHKLEGIVALEDVLRLYGSAKPTGQPTRYSL